jgi:hypothetical protein
LPNFSTGTLLRGFSPSFTTISINTFQHSFIYSAILKSAYYGGIVSDKNTTSITPTFVKELVQNSKQPLFVPETYLQFKKSVLTALFWV